MSAEWVEREEDYSFFILKPDAVKRNMEEKIADYFRFANLTIGETQEVKVDPDLVDDHYSHVPEDVLDDLHEYFDDEVVNVGLLYGQRPVERTREIVGDNFRPEENSIFTIRGSALDMESDFYDKDLIPHYDSRIADEWDLPLYNLVHAASDYEQAEEEARRFMETDENRDYIDSDIL